MSWQQPRTTTFACAVVCLSFLGICRAGLWSGEVLAMLRCVPTAATGVEEGIQRGQPPSLLNHCLSHDEGQGDEKSFSAIRRRSSCPERSSRPMMRGSLQQLHWYSTGFPAQLRQFVILTYRCVRLLFQRAQFRRGTVPWNC